MGRYERGDNEKIDRINDLVVGVIYDVDKDQCMAELLELFEPLILKLCSKWAKYFRDDTHKLIPFDTIVNDAKSWMSVYTMHKYIIDGDATYNNFIKSHLDSRIRYIYEKELKYQSKHIFPDPDRNGDREDMLDQVIITYSNKKQPDICDSVIMGERQEWLGKASDAIYKISEEHLNSREREIFTRCIVNGEAHQIIAESLGISRSRVSQIVCKIKKVIKENINADYWRIFDYENN